MCVCYGTFIPANDDYYDNLSSAIKDMQSITAAMTKGTIQARDPFHWFSQYLGSWGALYLMKLLIPAIGGFIRLCCCVICIVPMTRSMITRTTAGQYVLLRWEDIDPVVPSAPALYELDDVSPFQSVDDSVTFLCSPFFAPRLPFCYNCAQYSY